jgi:hypothetical protein
VSDWDGGALATLAGGCNPGLSLRADPSVPAGEICFCFLNTVCRAMWGAARPKCPVSRRRAQLHCALFDSWRGADDGQEMAGRRIGHLPLCQQGVFSGQFTTCARVRERFSPRTVRAR